MHCEYKFNNGPNAVRTPGKSGECLHQVRSEHTRDPTWLDQDIQGCDEVKGIRTFQGVRRLYDKFAYVYLL